MFNMKRFNPLGFLLALLLVGLIAVVTMTPVAQPIKSLDETYALLERLDMQWNQPGVPVIVFANEGCPASRSLEAALQREGVAYLRVDVYSSELTKEVHADLGRNYLGTVATRATPTIVVGTQVIRGSDVGAVLEAIVEENRQ